MSDVILVLNCGSSSLKFAEFRLAAGHLDLVVRGQIEGITAHPHFVAKDATGQVIDEHRWPESSGLDHRQATEFLVAWGHKRNGNNRWAAAGHRVVHGGRKFSTPVRTDGSVLDELEHLVPLAPLHQPQNLAAIRVLAKLEPDLAQVACFDTAFHRTQPSVAQKFAIPRRYTDEGVLRYGFHGLSYEYIAGQLASFDKHAAAGRAIVAHLGNGASMCALLDGKSVASTMGFTAIDGLPMGTRSGSLDPGVILYLLSARGMDEQQVENLLYHESGLLGVSGISSDVRTLLASPDPRAAEALELFTYRAGRELGSLAAALGGLDALVFTAGVGENAPTIRGSIGRHAAWLGLELDDQANLAGGPRISASNSRVSAWVIPTNEELMIARHTVSLLGESRL